MNLSSVLLLLAALLFGPGAVAMESVIGIYGETTRVPCDDAMPPWDTHILTMWRRIQGDGTAFVLTRRFHNATADDSHDLNNTTTRPHPKPALMDTDSPHDPRFSIDPRSGLVIERISVADSGVYTCVVLSQYDVRTRSVNVEVYTTVQPEIVDRAERLVKDRLVPLGTCVVRAARPAARITWQRDGLPLAADGKRVVIVSDVTTNPVTELSTTSSSLRYAATKEDVGARFNCRSDHKLGAVESDVTLTFPVVYSTGEAGIFPLVVGVFTAVAAVLLVLSVVFARRFCCRPVTDEENDNNPIPAV